MATWAKKPAVKPDALKFRTQNPNGERNNDSLPLPPWSCPLLLSSCRKLVAFLIFSLLCSHRSFQRPGTQAKSHYKKSRPQKAGSEESPQSTGSVCCRPVEHTGLRLGSTAGPPHLRLTHLPTPSTSDQTHWRVHLY